MLRYKWYDIIMLVDGAHNMQSVFAVSLKQAIQTLKTAYYKPVFVSASTPHGILYF